MENEEIKEIQEFARHQWASGQARKPEERSPYWAGIMVLCEIALRLLPPLE